MAGTIRAFLAIELPKPVRDALGAIIAELRCARVEGLRLVDPRGAHLTLKFLGGVAPELISDIEDAVAPAAARHPRLSLSLGEARAFPSRANPRVLWIDVAGDVQSLNVLQSDVEEALETLGFAKEKREFSPHLTVARLRQGASKANRRRAAEILDSANTASMHPVEIEAISLMRSMLYPSGAVYERLALIPLGVGAGG